jgi:hypothetical protein
LVLCRGLISYRKDLLGSVRTDSFPGQLRFEPLAILVVFIYRSLLPFARGGGGLLGKARGRLGWSEDDSLGSALR